MPEYRLVYANRANMAWLIVRSESEGFIGKQGLSFYYPDPELFDLLAALNRGEDSPYKSMIDALPRTEEEAKVPVYCTGKNHIGEKLMFYSANSVWRNGKSMCFPCIHLLREEEKQNATNTL